MFHRANVLNYIGIVILILAVLGGASYGFYYLYLYIKGQKGTITLADGIGDVYDRNVYISMYTAGGCKTCKPDVTVKMYNPGTKSGELGSLVGSFSGFTSLDGPQGDGTYWTGNAVVPPSIPPGNYLGQATLTYTNDSVTSNIFNANLLLTH